MLDRAQEYKKMAESEESLWWYQALHELTLKNILGHYPEKKDIAIVDAGCGTGGLLMFLKEKGYTNLSGFDLSEDAVLWCRKRGLNIHNSELLDIATKYTPNSIDVIISNDTLYFLDTSQHQEFVRKCIQLLRPGGILILNLPALKAFRGIHDIAVGIGSRFSKNDPYNLNDPDKSEIIKTTYWPFLLSPIIYLMRLIQRIKMKSNTSYDVQSDVGLPNPLVNSILLFITRLENLLLPVKPFGSSLFVVIKKNLTITNV